MLRPYFFRGKIKYYTDITQQNRGDAGSSASFTYGYNRAHQQTSLQASDAAFVAYPSARATSYAAGPMNQYTGVNGAAISYDKRGNLTGDGTNSFTYDQLNRMTAATTSAATVSFSYDALGNHLSATMAGATTLSLMDGNREIASYDGASGKLLARHVYGPGLDEHIVTVNAATNTKTWLHQDRLGTVIADSGPSGAVNNKYAYGPFGETSVMTGSSYRYTGRILDAATGLYYYRARMYSPVLGRFMQTDPIGYNGGNNLYAYVGNDPMNASDPSGLVDKNFMAPSDRTYGLTQVYTNSKYFTTSGHGSNSDTDHMYPKRDSDNQSLTVSQVWDAILSSSWDKKQSILSVMCYGSLGGDNSFNGKLALYLANVIGAPVTVRGSSDEITVGYNSLDYLFGGHADPGPSGWKDITQSPANGQSSTGTGDGGRS